MLGKMDSQRIFTKQRSSLTRVGVTRLLLQVYVRSTKGISMRARRFIALLNSRASLALKESLFLSAGSRVRLKSPMIAHAPTTERAVLKFSKEGGFVLRGSRRINIHDGEVAPIGQGENEVVREKRCSDE